MRMNPADAQVFLSLFRTAWDRVVWPYLRWVFSQTDPVDALKKGKHVVSGVGALLGGIGGAAAGGAIAVATMGTWASIGYWLGLVSLPLWGPVVGGIAAAAGVGGGIYAALWKLEKRDRIRLATLYAHALNVVIHADGVQTAAERDEITKMKDRLIAMGMESADVARLFEAAPTTADEFQIPPKAISHDLIVAALEEVWLSAVTARSIGDDEQKAFARLCARLAIPEQAETLRAKVDAMRDGAVRRAPAVATATVYAVPPEMRDGAGALFDQALDIDFTGNARRRRNQILATGADLAAAAASIAAVATGHPELLAVIGQAYAVARAAVIDDPEGEKKTKGRTLELASRLGMDRKEVMTLLAKVDDLVEGTRKETAKAAKAQSLAKTANSQR